MIKKYQLRSYNFRLIILLIVISIFGIAVINSADPSSSIKQCIGLVLGLTVMFFVSLIDYHFIMKFYWLLYFINIALLVSVKFLGVTKNGATRWFKLFGIQFQPSELCKIIMILFTVKIISMYKDKINSWKFLIILAILLLIPLGLVLIEPNLSTTILIASILFTIVFCSGLSYRIIGLAILILVPTVAGAILYVSNPNQVLLKDYQRDRIMAFLEPEENGDTAYQQNYSVQAVGSGQLTGKGLNNTDPSSLKNADYIAEAQTDFIFAVVGEELGFLGCCFAILLLSWIVIECIITAVRAKDLAGRLICCGVASYIALQSFINIAVVTRVLPNTGLPLPFISYGLTSLVVLYMTMGIVLNIGLQRNVERDEDIFADDFRG
jgi:rod shape determining protein RodA